jgi:glycosyltransferase involved in cell wall biosynthesis
VRISVITVTYNSSATIKDTLESVKGQAYPEVEHIIVDGLSTDETLGIVSGYSHVSKVISEKDAGIYDAMNKGVLASTGDVVGILNSDDFYYGNDVLSKVAAVFNEKKCDALYGDLQYVDQKNLAKVIRHWEAGKYSADAFKWGWMPPHPTFFVRRELYEKWGRFNTQFRTAADYELMLRFIHKHHGSVEYIPDILVRMRTGGASNRSFKGRLRAHAEDKLAWSINGLDRYWFTLFLKPLRKIIQYIKVK